MGFPSPATDYVEATLDLNRLFVDHPSATSMVEFGGLIYIVDSALTASNGDTVCYELFGEVGIGKLLKGRLITADGETMAGSELEEMILLGSVILTITKHYDEHRPTI